MTSQRAFPYLFLFLLLPLHLAVAQEATSGPPPYRGANLTIDGVFVTPVPGAAFWATVRLESTMIMADGEPATRHARATIARDSRGRIYNERRQLQPASIDTETPMISSRIFDPETRVSTLLNPNSHLARQRVIPVRAKNDDSSGVAGIEDPLVKHEDLGTDVMQNVTVRGTRVSRTIPAEVAGTAKDIVVVVETWYSDQLHMNMVTKSSDPRFGKQVLTLTDVVQNEPDPKMFLVPAGYKIVDENPAN